MLSPAGCLSRIEREFPTYLRPMRQQDERNGLVVGIEEDQQCIINNPVASGVYFLDRIAGKSQS